MIVGIQSDYGLEFDKFSEKYIEILEYNNIEYIKLDINTSLFWDLLRDIDVFIYRWTHFDAEKQIAKDILPIIENVYRVKCFPDQNTSWHYDDKVKQYFLLKAHLFPQTDTWIFYNRESALKWADTADYPVVYKLRGGAGSQNVLLIKNKSSAIKYINRQFRKGIKNLSYLTPGGVSRKQLIRSTKIFGGKLKKRLRGYDFSNYWLLNKKYIYFQKFLPENKYDTRITVIGNRAYALQRSNRKNDFRASGSGLLNYNKNDIDTEMLKTAFEVSKKLKFQSMAYDFLYDNGKPVINEISYTFPHGSFLLDCPGYWDKDINWHNGRNWPQYFQLVDLLNMPGLKQPEF